MARFTLEDLARGLDDSATVSLQSRSQKNHDGDTSVGETGRRPLEETKALIKKVIRKEKRALKLREIARLIDRRPTPRLRQILKDMVDFGELIQDSDTAVAGNMERFWYYLP